jgi:hypothetical protein
VGQAVGEYSLVAMRVEHLAEQGFVTRYKLRALIHVNYEHQMWPFVGGRLERHSFGNFILLLDV